MQRPDRDELIRQHEVVRRARQARDEQALVDALSLPVEGVLAASYLGEVGTSASALSLVPYLSATDPRMRMNAVGALGRIGTDDICPMIRRLSESDEVPWVRAAAVEALGSIGCPDGEAVLIAALDDPSRRVRRTAAIQLGRSGSGKALSALRGAARRDWVPFLRPYRGAIKAIGKRSTVAGDRG